MRKWFSLFLLLVMLLIPARANAQTVLGFESLDVSVWPEFDKPTALVIYNIALAPQTPLPAEITLRLPPSVKDVFVVAVGATRTSVTDRPKVDYTITPGSDYSRLTIKATALFIEVDYYDANLIKNGNQRKYTYEWPGDYSVNNFRFELQKPLRATNLTTDPVLTSTGPANNEGFEFSGYNQSSIKAGQKLAFSFQYQRDTDDLSTSFLPVESSTPLDQASGQSTWTTYLPWILGGVGLILLLIAARVYWTSGRANRAMAKSRKRHTLHRENDVETDQEAAHCSQCGKRAQPDDRFCRVCGARIRRGEV